MPTNTLTRAESSRLNGAKSRGPKTEAGKRRSSQNALRHGFLAKCILLDNESPEVFQQVVDYHIEKFKPADDVEDDLIEEMVAAGWRMRRLWFIETNLFNEAANQADKSTTGSRIVAAFSRLADGGKLDLLDRYESRLHKMYQRALKTLLQIRQSADLPLQPDESPLQPNEPEPAPEPATDFPPQPNEPKPAPDEQEISQQEQPNEPEPIIFTLDRSGRISYQTPPVAPPQPPHPGHPNKRPS